MIGHWLARLEVWPRHRAERKSCSARCFYCNITLRGTDQNIAEVIQCHLRHPSHKAAKARKEADNG